MGSLPKLLFIPLVFSFTLTIPYTRAEIQTPKGKTQKPPAAVSLESFRALVFSQSPLVRLIDAEFADRLATSVEIRLLKNPTLSTETQFSAHPRVGAGDNQIVASIDQPLRISDFGSRARVALLMEKAASLEQERSIFELSQKSRIFHTRLSLEQQRKQIFRRLSKQAQDFIPRLERSATSGLVSRSEYQFLQGEAARLEAEEQKAKFSIAFLQQQIGLELLVSLEEATFAAPSIVEIPNPTELLERAKQSSLSESTRITMALSLATESTILAKKDSISPFTPRMVYEHTNDGSDFFGVGISMPLPVWDRNQAQIQRSAAHEKALRQQRQFLEEKGIETRLAHLTRSILALDAQQKIYRTQVLQHFSQALESVSKELEQGKGSIAQVIQLLRSLTDAEEHLLGLTQQQIATRTELSLLIGDEI